MHECDFRNGLNLFNLFWHCWMIEMESLFKILVVTVGHKFGHHKFKIQQGSFFCNCLLQKGMIDTPWSQHCAV